MRTKVLTAVAWMFLSLLVAKALWTFALSAPPSDAYIIQGVGRGILNGLRPYADLFETKAVGSFYLSALSLWISGGFETLTLLHILGVLLLLWMMWDLLRTHDGVVRLVGMGLVLILALYNFGFAYLADFYATLAGCCGIYAVTRMRKRPWKIFVGSLFMGIVLLLREPVAVVMAAGLLLFCKRPRDLLDLTLLCLAGAGTAILCLLLLGDWDAFTGVYIPNLIGTRVSESSSFVRGLVQWDLVPHFFRFSPAFFLSVIAILVMQSRNHRMFLLTLPIALYATNLVVNAATFAIMFYANFAVPLLFAILVLWASSPDRFKRWMLALSLIGVLMLAPSVLSAKPGTMDATEEAAVAAEIDRIMDSCGVDRYFHFARSHEIAGTTVHSPFGPLFFLDGQFLRDENLILSLSVNVRKADLVVSAKSVNITRPDEFGKYLDDVQAFMLEEFTREPWPCAGDVPSFDDYLIGFRKNRLTPAPTTVSPAGLSL